MKYLLSVVAFCTICFIGCSDTDESIDCWVQDENGVCLECADVQTTVDDKNVCLVEHPDDPGAQMQLVCQTQDACRAGVTHTSP